MTTATLEQKNLRTGIYAMIGALAMLGLGLGLRRRRRRSA